MKIKESFDRLTSNLSPGIILMLFVGILLLILSNSLDNKASKSRVNDSGTGIRSLTGKEDNNSWDRSGENATEERFRILLESIEGIGECQVMLSKDMTGVCIVCEGADNSETAKEIRNISMALFDIPAHKVMIVKLKGV